MKTLQIYIKMNNKLEKYDLCRQSINKDYICEKLNINSEDYYLTCNNRLLSNDNINNNDIINVNRKLNGGVLDLIIETLNAMFTFIKNVIPLLDDFIALFVKIIEMIPLIFKPDKFINQQLYGTLSGLKLIFGKFLNSFDSDAVSKHENDDHNNGPFGVSRESQAQNKNVCVSPSLFRLIILVLCPPLAIFLHKGLAGILSVILCSLMTYFLYYFPGFIYAALVTLC